MGEMLTELTIVDKIRAKQEQAGLNNTEFAKKIGISRVSWHYICTGRNKPTKEFFAKVVRVFPELSRDILQELTDELFKGQKP